MGKTASPSFQQPLITYERSSTGRKELMRLLPPTLACQPIWSLFMSGLGNYTAEVSGVAVLSFLGDILTAHNLHVLSSGSSPNLRWRSYTVWINERWALHSRFSVFSPCVASPNGSICSKKKKKKLLWSG